MSLSELVMTSSAMTHIIFEMLQIGAVVESSNGYVMRKTGQLFETIIFTDDRPPMIMSEIDAMFFIEDMCENLLCAKILVYLNKRTRLTERFEGGGWLLFTE